MKQRNSLLWALAALMLTAVLLLPSCQEWKGSGQETGSSTITLPTDDTGSGEIEVDTTMNGNKYKHIIYNEKGIRVSFGVVGGQNLFEPNADIPFWFTIAAKELNGTEAKVQLTSIGLRFFEEKSVTLSQPDSEQHTYTGSFTAEKNGIYTMTLILEDDLRFSFRIGVVPKNEKASDIFYFGVQPYICRAYTWGSGYTVKGQTVDESEASILNTIEWLGCNLIREDGTVWETMQPTENSEINYIWMDRLADATDKRDIVLNWLLQTTPRWAVKEEYLSWTDENMYWSVCPQEDKWDAYATALANRYAAKDNIFWEIWNEPDWEFFTGTPEDYLDLLERTAKIFRAVNPEVHLYPGGLTVVNDPSDYRYKDSRPYFAGFKKLLDQKLIDTFAIHIHGTFNDTYFFNTLNAMTQQAEEAGLSMSGIYNTEAGLYSENEDIMATNLMAKILYSRGHDYKMYVQYDFRATPSNESNAWAIFDSSLSPRKAAIAYAVLIGKLGQAEKVATISDSRSLYADLYYDGEQSIVTVFNDGASLGRLTVPEGIAFEAYDLYGNPIDFDGTVDASLSAVYLVCDGKISADGFVCE